jgi:hypothetical protein
MVDSETEKEKTESPVRPDTERVGKAIQEGGAIPRPQKPKSGQKETQSPIDNRRLREYDPY